jgi:hypothetical protein
MDRRDTKMFAVLFVVLAVCVGITSYGSAYDAGQDGATKNLTRDAGEVITEDFFPIARQLPLNPNSSVESTSTNEEYCFGGGVDQIRYLIFAANRPITTPEAITCSSGNGQQNCRYKEKCCKGNTWCQCDDRC